MINKFLNSRHIQVLTVLVVLAVVLMVRLVILTIFQGEKWKDSSENISTRNIYTAAPRGEIYDRNGKLLAGNKQSFSVRMSGTNQTDKELNGNITNLIKVLEKNGDQVVGDFPILIENGQYKYTFEKDIENWLTQKGINKNLNAEEAFNVFRNKLGIDPSLDRYQAQLEIQNKYNQYPPISVKDMRYTAEVEKEEFLERYFGDNKKMKDLSAKEAFAILRKELEIDATLSDAEALKVLTVRNEIKALGYNQYMPAVVAKGLSNATVMYLEEERESLKGVEVVSETTRYYPNSNVGSHILGYMGKITEEEKEQLSGEGYERNALIGKEGVEGNFEKILKGRNGAKTIRVNAKGQLSSVVEETKPVKGNDVYLTIDLELQKAAENGLKKTINAMRYGGVVQSEYGNSPISKPAPNAKTGAVVAIDISKGDVLAMASYPDYDPNLFAEGISEIDWESLQSENLRDPLAPAPLYNLATMSSVQPGSTFKPVTAIAALEAGLNPYASYVDGGNIKLGSRDFACVVWNLYKQNHGAINMFRAIEVSCNYYFYDIATGKDWYTGNSLGFKEEMTVDKITDYAKQFGLGESTGIEINESVVPVPTEARKIDALKTTLGYYLYGNAEQIFTKKAVKNPELLEKNINEIKGWIDEKDLTWEKVMKKMDRMDINDNQKEKVAEKVVFDIYTQASWTTADAFNIAIGQGENSYTPLQMANYIATLGNKGEKNQVSLVKSVENQGKTKKTKASKVNVSDDKYFEQVIEGMRRVATGKESTISGILGNMDVSVAAKTGTAEKEGRINPSSEVEYIKKHLGSIAPTLTWEKVDKEMKRLMKEYPKIYVTEDAAVRKAVLNLGGNGVTETKIDSYKGTYDSFAWVVAMAPADNPQIAVCAMVPQGYTAANVAPIVKEVLGKYFDQEENYTDFKIVNSFS